MVNKCTVVGCRSLRTKQYGIKLHRFPLKNKETLPLWMNATGRKDWKAGKSSRICSNHFLKSQYKEGHQKGVLKSTAVPTINYSFDVPRYTQRKNKFIFDNDLSENENSMFNHLNTEYKIMFNQKYSEDFHCNSFNQFHENTLEENNLLNSFISPKNISNASSMNNEQIIANSKFKMAMELGKCTQDVYAKYFQLYDIA